ncbi:hypothetical protein V8C86DRAFT_2439832 [Haematococcus lacustris]
MSSTIGISYAGSTSASQDAVDQPPPSSRVAPPTQHPTPPLREEPNSGLVMAMYAQNWRTKWRPGRPAGTLFQVLQSAEYKEAMRGVIVGQSFVDSGPTPPPNATQQT